MDGNKRGLKILFQSFELYKDDMEKIYDGFKKIPDNKSIINLIQQGSTNIDNISLPFNDLKNFKFARKNLMNYLCFLDAKIEGLNAFFCRFTSNINTKDYISPNGKYYNKVIVAKLLAYYSQIIRLKQYICEYYNVTIEFFNKVLKYEDLPSLPEFEEKKDLDYDFSKISKTMNSIVLKPVDNFLNTVSNDFYKYYNENILPMDNKLKNEAKKVWDSGIDTFKERFLNFTNLLNDDINKLYIDILELVKDMEKVRIKDNNSKKQ